MEGGESGSKVKQIPSQPDEFGLGSIPHHLLLCVATSGRGEVLEEELREGGTKGGRKGGGKVSWEEIKSQSGVGANSGRESENNSL